MVIQAERLGTGHAVLQAMPSLRGVRGDAIVLFGDTPFVRAETLEAMLESRAQHDVSVLGFEAADPDRYGRLVTEGDALLKIVEFKDATADERRISLCNSGVICADLDLLHELLPRIGNANAAGEFYLTDIVELARATGRSAGVVRCPEPRHWASTRARNLRPRKHNSSRWPARTRWRVRQPDRPRTVFFALDTHIGRDA